MFTNSMLATVPATQQNTYVVPQSAPLEPQRQYTSAELFRMYIDYIDRKQTTVKGYLSHIKPFGSWLAEHNLTLQKATRDDIRRYRDYLDRSDLATRTKGQYFRAAKALIHWAFCEGFIQRDIGDNIHGWKINEGHARDSLQREDVPKIAATIDRSDEHGRRLYAMFLLCVVCGLRTIEIRRANVGDIKTVGGKTYLYLQGKGHDDKDAPVLLIEEVYDAIQDYLQNREAKPTAKSPLFTSTSNRSKGGRIATTTISTMLKEMLVNAGYDSDRLTAHSLRHTCGTGAHKAARALNVDLDLYDVQHLMRHCDPKTTEIYIHDDEHEKTEGLGRRAIYNYYFKGEELHPIIPELEAEIMNLTAEEQNELLEQIRAKKGRK